MKYLLLLILLYSCSKEFSCEDCGGRIDTIQIPVPAPLDTIYNDLITTCDIYLDDPQEYRAVYPSVTHKKIPGHYRLLPKIEPRTRIVDTFDLKDYISMDGFYKGDSFYVRYELRRRFGDTEYVQHDTLVY